MSLPVAAINYLEGNMLRGDTDVEGVTNTVLVIFSIGHGGNPGLPGSVVTIPVNTGRGAVAA